jgi:hypothetical protein
MLTLSADTRSRVAYVARTYAPVSPLWGPVAMLVEVVDDWQAMLRAGSEEEIEGFAWRCHRERNLAGGETAAMFEMLVLAVEGERKRRQKDPR